MKIAANPIAALVNKKFVALRKNVARKVTVVNQEKLVFAKIVLVLIKFQKAVSAVKKKSVAIHKNAAKKAIAVLQEKYVNVRIVLPTKRKLAIAKFKNHAARKRDAATFKNVVIQEIVVDQDKFVSAKIAQLIKNRKFAAVNHVLV